MSEKPYYVLTKSGLGELLEGGLNNSEAELAALIANFMSEKEDFSLEDLTRFLLNTGWGFMCDHCRESENIDEINMLKKYLIGSHNNLIADIDKRLASLKM